MFSLNTTEASLLIMAFALNYIVFYFIFRYAVKIGTRHNRELLRIQIRLMKKNLEIQGYSKEEVRKLLMMESED